MRYFFEISYLGTKFSGWQRQKDAYSIQEEIETALSSTLKEKTGVIGCGRTDAGVHAKQFFFHLDMKEFPKYDLKWRLNKMLSDNISIIDIKPVSQSLHARFGALSRTYEYHMHFYKDPIKAQTSSLIEDFEFDIDLLNSAVSIIANESDFKYFCRQPDKHNTTICNIYGAEFYRPNNDNIDLVFKIKANRFLKSMVRIVVQRLLNVGSKKLTLEQLKSQFDFTQPKLEIKQAPPQGLYLAKVEYP